MKKLIREWINSFSEKERDKFNKERQKANKELANILLEVIQNNPTQRFSQILVNYGFVKPNRPTKDRGDNWQNEFYEEPQKILQRVKERSKK